MLKKDKGKPLKDSGLTIELEVLIKFIPVKAYVLPGVTRSDTLWGKKRRVT